MLTYVSRETKYMFKKDIHFYEIWYHRNKMYFYIEIQGGLQMVEVISIVNQKGGVGKTTTSVNLAAYLRERGKRALLVDLDPQGNATSAFGIDKMHLNHSIYDHLVNGIGLKDIIIEGDEKSPDICPTNINLAGAEVELVGAMSRESILARGIQEIEKNYDYVIIDCPPSLGLLTVNALTASSSVIVPIQGEYYALEGLTQLVDTINLVKKHLNPKLYILGVVITMYDPRTQLTKQVTEEVRRYFGDKVFKTVIPRNVRLAEAPSFGKSILTYDSHSRGARAYRNLAIELINRKKEQK